MSFASDLLPELDSIRGIPGELGLRPFTVTLIRHTWASGTVGRGAKTTTETVLRVGGQNVKAKQATPDEVRHILGDGAGTREGTWLIGPMTPEILDPADFDGALGTATETFIRLQGQGFPAAGTLFRPVARNTDSALRFSVLVEPASRGQRP